MIDYRRVRAAIASSAALIWFLCIGPDTGDSANRVQAAQLLADDFRGAIQKQTDWLSQARRNQAAIEASAARVRAMQDKIAALFYREYEEARKQGLKVDDPTDVINQINLQRQRDGIWPIQVQRFNRNDPDFVVLTDAIAHSRDPSFVPAGFSSMVGPSTFVKDEQLANEGILSSACQLQISFTNIHWVYDCRSVESGQIDQIVLRNLAAGLRADLSRN